MRTFLAAILLVQAGQAPPDPAKVEAALKKFGVRTYKGVIGGKTQVTVELKTRIERDGDRSVVVHDDRLTGKIGDKDLVDASSEKASLPGLKLLSITEWAAPDKVKRLVTVKDGRATAVRGDEKTEFNVTPTTTGLMSVFRALCIRDQKVGDRFTLDLVRGADRLESGHVFTCADKESIEINGVKVDAFRWNQTWEFKDEILDETVKLDQSYWVSPEGYLLRFVGESFEMTLETREPEAK